MNDFSSGDEIRNLSIIICERIPIRTYFSSNAFFEAIGRLPILCARKRDASLPKLKAITSESSHFQAHDIENTNYTRKRKRNVSFSRPHGGVKQNIWLPRPQNM